MCKYSVIIKTGEAEIRAIENSSKAVLNQIFPLIEITRGRKTKDGYPFDKRFSMLKELFAGQRVAIDLTSDPALSSPEIDELYDPTNGYENWVNFLVGIKNENTYQFKEVVPTILLNTNDPDYSNNLLLQVQNLKKEFFTILYRNDITDDGCYDDFELLNSEFQELNLFVMVDCEYTAQATQNAYADKVISRIKNIKSVLNEIEAQFIVSATSFPNNVSELGDVETDTFNLAAIQIYDTVSKQIPNIIYGDYASINPTRNDNITMARGWIPRIDVALENSIYYYKKRRPKGISAYSSTYTEVARLVVQDKRFPNNMANNWGIRQIISCSNGAAPGSQPRFWISVRMNIHLEQQVKRLSLNI